MSSVISGNVGTVVALWRYPVKSMQGEQISSSVIDRRALHADRMWAVRDLELKAVTTARRLPMLLGCSARYVEEPAIGVGPGDVAHVVVTFPDGSEIVSTDRDRMNRALSDLTGKSVALVSLPPVTDKAAYRGVMFSKKDIRQQFQVADGDPLPDFSMFPLRKLAELAIFATPVGIFADAYPVHILTTSSLKAMAAIGGDFDVRRFRPNILVETTGEGLVEQDWIGGTLRTGTVGIRVEVPTVRCSVPLRPQPGLEPDPAVVKTISRHNDRCLGVYADVTTVGSVSVGDAVEFVPTGQPGIVGGSIGRLAGRIKRNAVRAGNRVLPG
ncbi:MOSC domain-containing protein [Smaragdicoccus niigatensis]|uniref:MOSC domain-containing protein n=1 Tax=Smaragdicoccus niigatensis TaxID=359359 RepID=UPI00037D4B1F|nr:MOSC N-terminal beta barrel domain-containing protein [Smaragdicoccus niigatensis]